MKYTTIIEGLLRLCQGDGASREEVNTYLEARSKSPAYWWRILRRTRESMGYEWDVDERQGQIRVTITKEPKGD